MKFQKVIVIYLVFILGRSCCALEPSQILVITNGDFAQSVELGTYYCEKRGVPLENMLKLSLGSQLEDSISRKDYQKKIAEPVRKTITSDKFKGSIRCLLTTYGVPYKAGPRGTLQKEQKKFEGLNTLIQQEKEKLEQLEQSASNNISEAKKVINDKIKQLQTNIDYITGRETNASVDSELSMVLFDNYELYRWQPNTLKSIPWDTKTLMVSRLDGPGLAIAKSLVDKAVWVEKKGLNGIAYFDSRGLPDDKKPYSFGCYDQSLRDLVLVTKIRTNLPVRSEQTEKLFQPGECPMTAIYCGWYSLKKYIDAFDFVDGAVGYHISSWEAIELREPNSSQWCPAMLKKGITATLGAVAEPYLHSFPQPKAFFEELFSGNCLVEAYYHTKPFNSWQLILIGDPLYTPFKKLFSSSI